MQSTIALLPKIVDPSALTIEATAPCMLENTLSLPAS